jgi:hypothetical protein
MVEVQIDEEYVSFIINNNGTTDLKRFYTIEYFEFIGINPEIYIKNASQSAIIKGGYFQEVKELTIPYRYFVNFIENAKSKIIIKNVVPFSKKEEVVVPNNRQTFLNSLFNNRLTNSILNNVDNKRSVPDNNVDDMTKENVDDAWSVSDNNVDDVRSNMTEENVDDVWSDVRSNMTEEKMDDVEEKMDDVEEKMDDVEEKVDDVEEKVDDVEEKVDDVEEKVDDVEEKMDDVEEKVDDVSLKTGNKSVENNGEVIMIKIKLDTTSKTLNLLEIIKENKDDHSNIEKNKNGLSYDEMENIFKIRHFLKMEVYQDEVFRVNGRFIVIKDSRERDDSVRLNIKDLDTSVMKCTLLMKKYY